MGSTSEVKMQLLFILVVMSTMGRLVAAAECIPAFETPKWDKDEVNLIEVPTAQVVGISGTNASIPCNTQPLLANDTVSLVLWFKGSDRNPVYSYDVRKGTTSHPKLWSSSKGFGSRAYIRATATSASLLIDNVDTFDTGVYLCRVDFSHSPTRNSRISFVVRPLTVQIRNKIGHLFVGKKYQIECRTTYSGPKTQITWWKETLPLSKKARNNSSINTITSILELLPVPKDHGAQLTCRAENPNIANSVVEDTWKLNVYYAPIVNLNLGSNLNGLHIKEGYDIYLQCNIQARPKVTKLFWFKDAQKIQQNASAGIILTGQSLVLQNVQRGASGNYTCFAENSMGIASSNPVSLQVEYSPVCKSENGKKWRSSKLVRIDLHCVVDSNPLPTTFEWILKTKNDYRDVPPSLYITKGDKSILRYIPTEDRDFGTLYCFATNDVGRQAIPCTYYLVPKDINSPPTALKNCSIVNESMDSILVNCLDGFDGRLQQVFIMEVIELPNLKVRANITSFNKPNFQVIGLNRRLSYALNLFAANINGRSEKVTMYISALDSADRNTDKGIVFTLTPLTTLLLVAGAVLVAVVVTVTVAACTRRSAGRHCEQPVALPYLEDSSESLPKRDNSPPPTRNVSFSNLCELNIYSEEEDDPDNIHVLYDMDKKLKTQFYKSKVVEEDSIKMYLDQPVELPDNETEAVPFCPDPSRTDSDLRAREGFIMESFTRF